MSGCSLTEAELDVLESAHLETGLSAQDLARETGRTLSEVEAALEVLVSRRYLQRRTFGRTAVYGATLLGKGRVYWMWRQERQQRRTREAACR